MESELSPTMQAAFDYAVLKGAGKLKRFPCGFWSVEGFSLNSPYKWFGTGTINALVSRDRAVYTDWQTRRDNSRFPVEATVVDVVKE